MADHLEDRLRRLPLRPPGDLAGRAMQAASEVQPEEESGRHIGIVELVGALVLVALVVAMTITLAGPTAGNVFSNISSGLGS